ncbi:MAG: GGDEF domain-containing protein [Phycisphaerales bacterium]|nr:MAG: GGDEF domain-containing protein [Phycisphaerales bacterium]
MSDKRQPSISGGFAWAAARAFACASVVAVTAFAVAHHRSMIGQAEHATIEKARLCAAALVPGPDGNIWDAVDSVRSQYEFLSAVATLDATGAVQTVYPPSRAYEAAAAQVLAAGGQPVSTTVSVNGREQELWGVTVALNGSQLKTSRRVVCLFIAVAGDHWQRTTTSFAAMFFAGVLASFVWLLCWFVRRVVVPLRNLAEPIPIYLTPADDAAALDAGRWYETQQIASTRHRLQRDLCASDAEVRQTLANAQNQLRTREQGFVRQLRRAEDREMTDPLTGAKNRSFLDTNLERLFTIHQACKEDLSVAMIDVDNFKNLNDTRGHKTGDDILRFVGELLRGSIRPRDYVVRYGGDEFLLLFPGVSVAQAVQITERIVKLFAQYVAPLGGDTPLSLSAGVVSLESHHCEDGYSMLAKADSALYAAKRKGKNSVATSCAT